ncbi:hypothetical protein [Kitasatospora sp. NBC_00315]|uniref:hypothetical protein n=1 Tax=Kitasatospora sp. NBC_00315 TaxID=2975963 RepID=UPI003249A407
MNDSTGVASVDQIVVWCVAITAIIGLLAWVVRAVRRIARIVDDFAEDWNGSPPRRGVPARPGVMERLDRIEHELHPNSGSSLRDAVNRIEDSICTTTNDT